MAHVSNFKIIVEAPRFMVSQVLAPLKRAMNASAPAPRTQKGLAQQNLVCLAIAARIRALLLRDAKFGHIAIEVRAQRMAQRLGFVPCHGGFGMHDHQAALHIGRDPWIARAGNDGDVQAFFVDAKPLDVSPNTVCRRLRHVD